MSPSLRSPVRISSRREIVSPSMLADSSRRDLGPRRSASRTRPRTWRVEPSKRGCARETAALVGAGSSPPSRRHAHRRMSGHSSHRGFARQYCAPRSIIAWLKRADGERRRAISWQRSFAWLREQRLIGHGSREHAPNVGVEHGDTFAIGETGDRVRRVLPDPGQRRGVRRRCEALRPRNRSHRILAASWSAFARR